MTKGLIAVCAATIGGALGATLLTTGSGRATQAAAVVDTVAVAVFEGRTPCGAIANGFTGFPSANCQKIKWRLTLFHDAGTRRPSAFLYEGTRTSRRGSWAIERGTPFDPDARVHRLTPAPSGKPLLLLSVDDKVLLLLDERLHPVVGDASWSYALNRIGDGRTR